MKLKALGPNQTELSFGKYTVLFSYETPVAYLEEGVRYVRHFRTNTLYSPTTSGHINKWLGSVSATYVDQSQIDDLLDQRGPS